MRWKQGEIKFKIQSFTFTVLTFSRLFQPVFVYWFILPLHVSSSTFSQFWAVLLFKWQTSIISPLERCFSYEISPLFCSDPTLNIAFLQFNALLYFSIPGIYRKRKYLLCVCRNEQSHFSVARTNLSGQIQSHTQSNQTKCVKGIRISHVQGLSQSLWDIIKCTTLYSIIFYIF